MHSSRAMLGRGGMLDGFEGRMRGLMDSNPYFPVRSGIFDDAPKRQREMEPDPYFVVTSRSFDDAPKRQRVMEPNPYLTVTTESYGDGPNRLQMMDSRNPYYMKSSASSFCQTHIHSRIPSFPVVRLRGLPFTCEEPDVYDIFTGLNIVDCLLVKKDGLFSGEAFVVFSSPMQMELAIQRDRQTMGHRYIEVFDCIKEEYYVAVADHVDRQERFGSGDQQSVPRVRPRKTHGDQDRDRTGYTEILKLRGLPYSVTESEVMEFFRDYDLREEKVRIVRRADGKASGEAYVAFAAPQVAKAAMNMDRKMIGSRYVELFPLTPDQTRMAEL